MGRAGGGQDPDLIQELLDHPEQFEFFQAVRLIERAVAERNRQQPVHRVGSDEGPRGEALRFRALASLTFPVGQISSLTVPESAGESDGLAEPGDLNLPVEMTVPFMGLTGPNGVLPEHYTSLVIERSHQRLKDNTLREFFDLFNHRAISLYFRAWEKYRFPFAYERRMQDGSPKEDQFTNSLYSLVGLNADGLRERFRFDDHVILFYGGLLAQQTRNAVSLEQLLADYFEIAVRVVQFCGQWLYLPLDNQSAMPSAAQRGGMNLCLGEDAVVGSRVWDVQSRFRVSLGPLSWYEFSQLLPGSERLECISQLIRFYVGIDLDFDVQLILRHQDVPACRLAADDRYSPRLGWNTWVGGSPASGVHAEDAIFRF